jgi:hypothetical protein
MIHPPCPYVLSLVLCTPPPPPLCCCTYSARTYDFSPCCPPLCCRPSSDGNCFVSSRMIRSIARRCSTLGETHCADCAGSSGAGGCHCTNKLWRREKTSPLRALTQRRRLLARRCRGLALALSLPGPSAYYSGRRGQRLGAATATRSHDVHVRNAAEILMVEVVAVHDLFACKVRREKTDGGGGVAIRDRQLERVVPVANAEVAELFVALP